MFRMTIRRPLTRVAAAALVAMVGASATAADSERIASAEARYQIERQRCLSGASHQDRETCLREAGAALAEARRGTLSNAPEPYAMNALQRCRVQPIEDRYACVARMTGRADVYGSVEGGGYVREHRELVIEAPPPAPPPPLTPPPQPDEPVQIIIVR